MDKKYFLFSEHSVIKHFGAIVFSAFIAGSSFASSFNRSYGDVVDTCGSIIEINEEVPGLFDYLVEPIFDVDGQRYHLEVRGTEFTKGDNICFRGIYKGRCIEDYVFEETFLCGEEIKGNYCGTMIFGNKESGTTTIPEYLSKDLEGKENLFFPRPSMEVIDIRDLEFLIKEE